MPFFGVFWSVTVGTDIVALAEETETVAARTTTEGRLQDTGERALVDVGDVSSVGSLVAAGDLGVVAALGLSLRQGGLVADGELDVASAGTTVTGLRKGHRSGGEKKSGGEELHSDGWIGWTKGFQRWLRGD